MRHPRIIIASDRPGQVTGQGFQNFFVATPGLVPIAASSTPAGTVPARPPSGGYGYRETSPIHFRADGRPSMHHDEISP
jgi:hypothetical protein